MLATDDQILELIPQRSPIVMIDQLLEADDDHAITQLSILPNNAFLSNGLLAEPGLVENIAQTAASHIGYSCKQKNIPIPIGYIVSIKDLRIMALPPVNSTVKTLVTVIHKVMDLTVITGSAELNGRALCTCEMRIFAKLNLTN
jgi:predicted hotdog family 3-hydroxylacyl-ACP dehydratase